LAQGDKTTRKKQCKDGYGDPYFKRVAMDVLGISRWGRIMTNIDDKMDAVIKIIEDVKAHYSTGIFGKDWTDEELYDVHEYLKTKGKTLDSLSGHYGRHYCNLILRVMKEKFNEVKDA